MNDAPQSPRFVFFRRFRVIWWVVSLRLLKKNDPRNDTKSIKEHEETLVGYVHTRTLRTGVDFMGKVFGSAGLLWCRSTSAPLTFYFSHSRNVRGEWLGFDVLMKFVGCLQILVLAGVKISKIYVGSGNRLGVEA